MRLSKTTSRVLGLSLAGGLLLLIGPAFGGGKPRCDPVSGQGETAVGDPGVFEGSGLLVIRGETFDVTFLVTGEDPWFGDDGTMHVVTSHIITHVDDESGDVSVLTTTDDAILEPNPDGAPGEYRLNSRMEISSGAGIFEGVGGKLTAHGTMDMFDEINNIAFPFYGEASYNLKGVICD